MIDHSRVIVALDYPDYISAMTFVNRVSPDLCALKVGSTLFTRLGPDFVRELIAKNFRVFLDLKYHDIPNTVFDACFAAAELGVWMLNVHALGGEKMMRAACDALSQFPPDKRPLLIAVTVLTSLDQADLAQIGLSDSIENTVLHLAKQAKTCGLDGVVCSAQEASILKKECGEDFLLVTPGIRLEDGVAHDQKRIVTPSKAIELGADYLVIGRAITHAEDPVFILNNISE